MVQNAIEEERAQFFGHALFFYGVLHHLGQFVERLLNELFDLAGVVFHTPTRLS